MSRRAFAVAASSIALLLPGSVHAAVVQSARDGFEIAHSIETTATPLHAYLAVTQPSRWWDPAHTWSGDADNLQLDARAGGCFCEKWKGSSVEHLHVVWATPPTELRLQGGLGPLQALGADGLLRIVIEPLAAGERL